MTISTPRLYLGLETPVQPLAAWGTAEAPPKEFLVFKFGQNHATLGGRREMVTLTLKRAEAIVNEWNRRRISGAFDYEHAVTEKSAHGTPAAGWFKLAVRSDGLWAVGITWTDRALAYFKGKEYRYFSPYFGANNKGEVTSLYNIALTNWPATDQQRPLIALSQRAMRRYTTMDATQAKAHAQKIADYVASKEYTVDGLALMLMELESGALPLEDPAEMLPDGELAIEEKAASPDEVVIANAAYKAFGTQQPKEVLAHFKQWSVILKRATDAEGELTKIKHTSAVEEALRVGKIEPHQKEEMLAMDPTEFRVGIRFAKSRRDDENLTPHTRLSLGAKLTKADYAKDPKLIAYVGKLRGQGSLQTVDDLAQEWSSVGTPFAE